MDDEAPHSSPRSCWRTATVDSDLSGLPAKQARLCRWASHCGPRLAHPYCLFRSLVPRSGFGEREDVRHKLAPEHVLSECPARFFSSLVDSSRGGAPASSLLDLLNMREGQGQLLEEFLCLSFANP